MAIWLRETMLENAVNKPEEETEIYQALLTLDKQGVTPRSAPVKVIDADWVNDMLLIRLCDDKTNTPKEWEQMYQEIPLQLITDIADDIHALLKEYNGDDLHSYASEMYIKQWLEETGRGHWIKKPPEDNYFDKWKFEADSY